MEDSNIDGLIKNRFIAFIDIMGFSNYMKDNPIDIVYKEIKHIVKNGKVIVSTFDLFGVSIFVYAFADSIVVFSEDNTEKSFKAFCNAVQGICANLAKKEFVFKGALAHGEMIADRKEDIYISKAYIEAYALQEKLNYFGIVVADSLDKFIIQNKIFINDLFCETKTPFKENKKEGEDIIKQLEKNEVSLNLKWIELLNQRKDYTPIIGIDKSISYFMEILKKKKNSSDDPIVLKYIDNTIVFIKECYSEISQNQ